MYDPEIRLLLCWRKQILIWKAKELGLETCGDKLALAKRIAKANEEASAKLWRSISGGTR